MLTIETNLAGVIGQTERLRRRIPEAMREALQPARWQIPAENLARRVLEGLAAPEEKVLIEPFVQTVLAQFVNDGLQLVMSAPALPGAGPLDVKGLVGAGSLLMQSGLGELPLFLEAFNASRDIARQVIRDWVATEKDLDERDVHPDGTPMTVDEITDRLMKILFEPVGEREAAAQNLLASEAERGPHGGGGMRLIDFFGVHPLAQGLGGGSGGMAALADRWLRAVLAAWREMVRTWYPLRVQQLVRQRKDDLL